ncbi:MAG: DUF1552 domain-containing protein [Myxococcales bacterium]|nr:MAG: DUF1552 domain-containing protein [Myxococcales bacterium]
MSKKLTRRRFLRGSGGVIVALPLFQSDFITGRVSKASAATSEPLRFVAMFRPNGTAQPFAGAPDYWWPTTNANGNGPLSDGKGGTFNFNHCNAPLSSIAPHVNFLHGLDYTRDERRGPRSGPNDGYPRPDDVGYDFDPGEGHQMGMGKFLTGRPLLTGAQAGGDGSLAGWASGISLDQHLAKTLSKGKRFSSLELGVHVTNGDVRGRMSYAGANQPLPPTNSPRAVFDRIFSDLNTSPTALQALRARRGSVLDTVLDRCKSYMNYELGYEERQRMEQHCGMIRDLEERIVATPVIGDRCQLPAVPGSPTLSPENIPIFSQLHIDLLVMAFACDLTRVATLQYSDSFNLIPFSFPIADRVNQSDAFLLGHEISHSFHNVGREFNELIVREKWYSRQVASFASKLAAYGEGSGSMLDNTVILWSSELAHGHHRHNNAPLTLIGGKNAGIKGGRYLQYGPGRPHNDLLRTIMNAVGVPGDSFGRPDWNTGVLEGLVS